MRKILIALPLLFCLGCQKGSAPGGSTDVLGSEDDPVTMVDVDDPEMAAAEKQARESLDDFIKAMQNPEPNQSDFSVKHSFKDGEANEHMWITDLTYVQGKFSGILGNEPALVRNMKIGDKVTINRDQVEDWLYFEGEELIGGYTAKLLMSREAQ